MAGRPRRRLALELAEPMLHYLANCGPASEAELVAVAFTAAGIASPSPLHFDAGRSPCAS